MSHSHSAGVNSEAILKAVSSSCSIHLRRYRSASTPSKDGGFGTPISRCIIEHKLCSKSARILLSVERIDSANSKATISTNSNKFRLPHCGQCPALYSSSRCAPDPAAAPRRKMVPAIMPTAPSQAPCCGARRHSSLPQVARRGYGSGPTHRRDNSQLFGEFWRTQRW